MDKYYSYENFDIDVNGSMLPLIIWGLYIGIVCGALGSILFRVYSSKIVKALISQSACDESSAKTLAELGLRDNFLFRYYLKDDSVLRRSVLACDGAKKPVNAGKFRTFWYVKFLRTSIPEKTDYSLAKFYIPEENRIAAELRFQSEDHPIRNFIFSAAGLFAVAVFATYAVPELLLMLDNFVTTVKPESKYW